MAKKALWLLFFFIFVLAGTVAAEETKPLQLALIETIQLVPASDSIKGLRLEVYGVNRDMTGFSWGFVHKTTGDAKAVEWGLVGICEGDFTGWQAGLLTWTEGMFKGLQSGFVNMAKSDVLGVQWGGLNWTENSFEGVQLGLVNYAGSARGLQFGFVNYTKSLNGLQIGLVNYNGNKDPLEYMVFVNWSF